MITLVWDPGFKRAYRKRVATEPLLKERFWDAIALFVTDPFTPELRTHKLTGNLSTCWAFSVDHDCRVVFLFTKGYLEEPRTDGTHDYRSARRGSTKSGYWNEVSN